MFEPDTHDPFELFSAWFAAATDSEPGDPTAMALATADAIGRPSVRTVLLKQADHKGFVFYSNAESRKGGDITVNPFAALCFHWASLRRQVRIEGPVSRVDETLSDAYFRSRQRNSQIGAWASQQSRPLASREAMMASAAQFEKEFAGREVPRPPYWVGMRVTPLRIEFWQEGPHRLHDRFLFSRRNERTDWTVARLYP